MFAHETSDEWNERQAKSLELDQPERSACNVGDGTIAVLRHRIDTDRRIQAGYDEQTLRIINDLLDLINPINDHDHREYGCKWCMVKRNAVSHCEYLRRSIGASKRT
jgi:hypothetical protein